MTPINQRVTNPEDTMPEHTARALMGHVKGSIAILDGDGTDQEAWDALGDQIADIANSQGIESPAYTTVEEFHVAFDERDRTRARALAHGCLAYLGIYAGGTG